MAYRKYFFVCHNQRAEGKACCGAERGAAAIQTLKASLQEAGDWGRGKSRVSASGCLGRCSEGPCMVVYTQGAPEQWYRYPDQAALEAIYQAEALGQPSDRATSCRLGEDFSE